MPALGLNQIDDFLESVTHKYERMAWKDISMNLQEYYFASRLFDKAGPAEEEGDLLEWKLQVDNNDNFHFTGLYADAVTSRKNLITHGQIGWSINTTNYTYDILEKVFRTNAVKIIEYIDTLEHSMNNDYFKGMELAMMGAGPTSPTQKEPPPCSLLWWIQPYNTASGKPNNAAEYQLPTGTTNGFYGMNPVGFDSVGTGKIDRKLYSMWRNRIGVYTEPTEDDLIDTLIECLDKCNFKPADQYAELSPGSRPRYEMLSTYSRVKALRRLLAAGNDSIKGDLAMWKANVPMVRGVPVHWVPAWSNSDFGLQRTDGLFLGVDWSSFKYAHASGLRMVKRPPRPDAIKPNVRWREQDDSGQLYCLDCRRNFAVTCTETVTEQN